MPSAPSLPRRGIFVWKHVGAFTKLAATSWEMGGPWPVFASFSIPVVLLFLLPTPLVSMIDSLSITNPYDILLPHHIVFLYSSRCEAHSPRPSLVVFYTRWTRWFLLASRSGLYHLCIITSCGFASPSDPTSLAVGIQETCRNRPGLWGEKKRHPQAADRERRGGNFAKIYGKSRCHVIG